MLIRTPKIDPDTTAPVSSRQNWPAATAWLLITNSPEARPPVTRSITHTPARMPINTLVAVPPRAVSVAPKAVFGARTPDAFGDAHFGHWNPTEAGFMHSPQIGRL